METRYRSWFTVDGKQYEVASAKSQREADKKALERKRRIENGEEGVNKNMTVAAFVALWLETYKRPTLTEKSFRNVERHVNKIIIPAIGNVKLAKVTTIQLQNMLNSRAGKSQSDVKKLRDIIKAVFESARLSRLIVYNPAEGKALQMPKTTQGKRRSITEFEREHFLKVAPTHFAGLMFQTMLYCGLRPGEIMALNWKDFDVQGHSLYITAAIESGTNAIKGPKTAAGVRTIPVPDVLYSQLLQAKLGPFHPVFTSTTGERYTEYSFRSSWKSFKNAMDYSMGARWEKGTAKDGKQRYMKTLSVVASDLIPYCLRHTYCTDIQHKGVPLKTASYLMGHTDISVTANIYTHVTETTLEETARLLGVNTANIGA